MKTIGDWKDLEPYGILPLTGEACGLMYRILCDLTGPGASIFKKCFGLARDSTLGEAWNRGTAEQPHVASVMLSRESLVPLGIFALLENGCTEAYVLDGTVIGLEADDPRDTLKTMCRIYKAECSRRFAYGGEYATHYPSIQSLSGIRDDHPSRPLSSRPAGRSRSVRCRDRS